MGKNVERMADFFDRRAASYDEHMRLSVAEFDGFYRRVAASIERTEKPVAVLDLGCGTGLELEFIFAKAPNSRVTAVDVSKGMLAELSRKYAALAANITTIRASFLKFDIGQGRWDYIVSVMAMHHLTHVEKLRLYRSIHKGLKPGGFYMEGDYVVSKDEEKESLDQYYRLREVHPEVASGAYHIDIPFCLDTQLRLLLSVGFTGAEIRWEEKRAAVFVARKD